MPMPKPKKAGRPLLPKGHAKASYLRVRVTAEENKRLTAVAKSKHQTVSEFIRGTLSAAIKA